MQSGKNKEVRRETSESSEKEAIRKERKGNIRVEE